jgi:flagellar motor protein MotB
MDHPSSSLLSTSTNMDFPNLEEMPPAARQAALLELLYSQQRQEAKAAKDLVEERARIRKERAEEHAHTQKELEEERARVQKDKDDAKQAKKEEQDFFDQIGCCC